MTDFTDEDLDHYLQNQVDLRHRQVSNTVEEVQRIIKDLTMEVSTKDSRFQSISNSGIHNDNLKDQPALVAKWSTLLRGKCAFNPAIQVLTPTLYLISVPIRGLMGYKERRTRQWRYYTLSGSRLLSPVREPEKLHQWLELESFHNTSQEWHDARVAIEGDIVPAKVVNVFKELLEVAIKACNLSTRNTVQTQRQITTRNLSHAIKLLYTELMDLRANDANDSGNTEKKKEDDEGKVSVLETVGSVVRIAVETTEAQIEVELVPTVEVMNCWPKKARWPRLLKRWPSTERARCIKSFGFNLMATSNYHWLLSFSRAEQVLLESIDEDGGCRRKGYRIIRQLKEEVWCPGSKPVITAYHLQTLLFWTCEKYPSSKDWRNLRESVLRLAKKLHKCASQRYLRHYFVRSYNLLKYTNTNELDVMAKKICDFLDNPGIYIH